MSDDVTDAIEKEAELLVRIEEAKRVAETLRELNERGLKLLAARKFDGAEAVLKKAKAVLQEWQEYEKRHRDTDHG